jgi:hypothetical protein
MAKRRTEVAGFTGVLAGLAIGAATLIATVGKQPVSNPWFIFFVVVAAASGVVFVAAGLAPVAGWVRRKLIARRKHKPLILDRWLYTTDGTKVPALAVAMEIRLPGTGTNGLPGTGRKPKDDLPPWVRYVVTMPCSEADHHDDPDSDYSRFESFLLQDDLVKKMVEVLTYMEGGPTIGHGQQAAPESMTQSLGSASNLHLRQLAWNCLERRRVTVATHAARRLSCTSSGAASLAGSSQHSNPISGNARYSGRWSCR